MNVAMLSPGENVSETPLLDLNNSTARTLVKTIGVTPTLARKIVSYRRQKGWYDHIGELWRIKQMTLPLFEAIASKYTVHRQYAKQPSRRLQNASKRFESITKSPDRDSALSGGRRMDLPSSSVSRNPNKQSVKKEGETQNVTDKTQRGAYVSNDVPLPQIRMDPIAVKRSVSGNVVMVTYKTADRAAQQGKAEADHVFNTGDNGNSATKTNLPQSEPGRKRTTTPDDPLTTQKLKVVEKSDENLNRAKFIEKWISEVNEAEDKNEKKRTKEPEKTQANETDMLSINPKPGSSGAKKLERTGAQDRNQTEPDQKDLRKHVESPKNNARSEKMDQKSAKMDHKLEKNRFEDTVPGTSVRRDLPSTKEHDKALPVNEIPHSKRKHEDAEQRHHRHKRHHSDRKDRRNEGRSPDVTVEKHRRSHRHDRHKRESAEKSKSDCQIM